MHYCVNIHTMSQTNQSCFVNFILYYICIHIFYFKIIKGTYEPVRELSNPWMLAAAYGSLLHDYQAASSNWCRMTSEIKSWMQVSPEADETTNWIEISFTTQSQILWSRQVVVYLSFKTKSGQTKIWQYVQQNLMKSIHLKTLKYTEVSLRQNSIETNRSRTDFSNARQAVAAVVIIINQTVRITKNLTVFLDSFPEYETTVFPEIREAQSLRANSTWKQTSFICVP